ncbi:MAG: response regulator [Eubacteriales bacterium]|nr:response regulator [Eubacteriales bacterium]
MFQESVVIAAEVMSVFMMLIVMLGLFIKKNRSKSTNVLIFVFATNLVCTLADLGCYKIYGPGYPDALILLLWTLSYSVGSLTLCASVWYWYYLISEHTTIKKRFFIYPTIVFSGTFIYQVIRGFTGRIVSVAGGIVTVTGGTSVLVNALYLLTVIYIFILIMMKARELGHDNTALILFVLLLPLITSISSVFFGAEQLLFVTTTFALVLIYVLIQTHHMAEREMAHKRLKDDSSSVFHSLGEIYSAMYYIDLRTDGYLEITCEEDIRKHVSEFKGASGGLNFFVNNMARPEDREVLREFVDLSTLNERMKDEKCITIEFKSTIFKTLDGSEKPMWRQAAFIDAGHDENGELAHVIFATRSIHESKMRELDALEAAEKANKAKTDFLFNMSHDIRTPLNAITGYRDLLEKHQDDPEKRQDYLDKMKNADDVLVSIVNNVLEMTRIEQGNIEVEETAGSIYQFCDGLNSIFADMMESKNIEFTTELKIQHEYVFADMPKTRELYMNLVSNSLKYTNPGGRIHLLVEEFPSEKEGKIILKTTLTDNGIGMDEDFLPHIFEPFARENNTTDAKIEGTGLGMPIVKKIIDLVGGTIDIKSHKGEGTVVTITAEHRIASHDDIFGSQDRTVNPEVFKGKRILLAEDNELNAEIATEILKEAGFEVEHAQDGKICCDMLAAAEAGYYDVVLMDIQMPNMNGYEAAVAIRKMNNREKASIPIVAVTANAFEEDRREAMRCGMNGHVAKPINVKELMVQLSRIFRKN